MQPIEVWVSLKGTFVVAMAPVCVAHEPYISDESSRRHEKDSDVILPEEFLITRTLRLSHGACTGNAIDAVLGFTVMMSNMMSSKSPTLMTVYSLLPSIVRIPCQWATCELSDSDTGCGPVALPEHPVQLSAISVAPSDRSAVMCLHEVMMFGELHPPCVIALQSALTTTANVRVCRNPHAVAEILDQLFAKSLQLPITRVS